MSAQLDLFNTPEPSPAPNVISSPPPLAGELRPRLAAMAKHGLFVGTSSWKYPGWAGSIYTEARYHTRGKLSEKKLEQECLTEYAQTFPTVCVDAGYYRFPSPEYIGGMADQVPDGFEFTFKVTDEITVKRWPNLPRHGQLRGMENAHFLNAEMFIQRFLAPCEEYRAKIGPLIFEFSTFAQRDFEHGRDFVTALDHFLGQLPKGWKYGVELRNKGWLAPEYFAMLKTHNVAHVFNNWTRMPSVGEQLALEGSDSTADFMIARFLLKPGRSYEASVEQFSPYKSIQEPNEEAQRAAAEFLARALKSTRRGYIYVNNRLEGFAPGTIKLILERLNEMRLKYVLIM